MGETFFTSIELGNETLTTDMAESQEISYQVETETVYEESSNQIKEKRHSFNKSDINIKSFLVRLKNSIERVYQTVSDMSLNTDDLEVAIELGEGNTILPTHNCMFCRKELKISYDTRKGKLKQFYTGNMKKHLIKRHTTNSFNEPMK